MNTINTVRVGIGVIIQKGNNILFGKRKNSHGQGTYALIGGDLEMG
jgi:8-oxo-dGTP diphosphatase